MALGARRKERLDDLAGRIEGDGGTAVALEVDVASEEQARGFVDRAAESLGGLDILVNNAGVMLLGPIEGADTEEWRRMIEVNLLGLLVLHPGGAAAAARGRQRAHRQPLLGRGAGRQPRVAASTT